MLAVTVAPELALPWESSLDEDKRFIRILRFMLLALLVLAIVVPFLPVSEPQRTRPEPVVEHLARIILEKTELPKVVPVVPKPKPKPKPVEKRKPKKPKPVDQTLQAKKVAQSAGVLAFQDDLQDLRDTVDVNALSTSHSSRGESRAVTLERSLITGAAKEGSGGIKTSSVSTDLGGVALSAFQSSQVESTVASATVKAGESQSARMGGRSDESIRREMDRNKGAIFAIYNRALRRDPLLEGKLVFEMVIDSTGVIDEIKLLSSELADEELTRKILSRIRMIQFESKNVISTRVNYSFDFLPYT